jgi:HTH-type transcriptional regulator / antitoxin HigA
MAVMLAVVSGNTAQEWHKWDQAFRLATADRDVADAEGRARLYETAPIREMTKRGWIQPAMDANALRAELEMFYGIDPLNMEISFPVATERTVKLDHLKPAEVAWQGTTPQPAPAPPLAPPSLAACRPIFRQ